MANQPLKGAARLRVAWANSLQGFKDIWRAEEAFRIECIVLLISIPAAILLTERALDAAILIATILLVLIVEILNSAVEAAIDRIGPERHELSRIAKDLGSLAVLLASALAALVWLGAFISALSSW